jgi:hypothetical protein
MQAPGLSWWTLVSSARYVEHRSGGEKWPADGAAVRPARSPPDTAGPVARVGGLW